ncbi:hypothetical protein AALP_AA3G274700 [Arabis alpina]|uniref:MADS-box domain-containing protein n=1 Tax=Arabis alpina TaxID=50452 RepID=A0A087HC23_ARAAL|nr:hypothetical protein AALP_AA3G274700 [Arabis alpina]
MVKKGGLKRKIPIEKIEKKTSRAPCYSKRCNGLFAKASQLCLLSGAQIAVLATPMSENSNVSFFSFGHSSVDGVVSAFLAGKSPPFPSSQNHNHIAVCLTQKSLGLGFWWEDEALTTSQNPQNLSDAVDSMSKLLKDVKQLRHGKETKKSDPTLTTPEIGCFSDDLLQNTDTHIMPYSQDFSIMDNNIASPAENSDGVDDIMDLIDFEATPESYDEVLKTTFESLLSDGVFKSPQELHEFAATHLTNSDSMDPSIFSHSQPVQDGDLVPGLNDDQLIDFESLLYDGVFQSPQALQDFAASLLTCSDSDDPTMFSHSQPVQDGDLMLQNRGFNDGHLHFSEFFNELTPIVTL